MLDTSRSVGIEETGHFDSPRLAEEIVGENHSPLAGESARSAGGGHSEAANLGRPADAKADVAPPSPPPQPSPVKGEGAKSSHSPLAGESARSAGGGNGEAADIDRAAAVANATATTTAAPTITFPIQSASNTASIAAPSRPLPDAPGGAGAVGGAVFALLLVVGLILALGWLAKRMPGLGGSSNAALRVVGSLSLGARERVVVVAVGDTQLLLSVGPGGTRTLHTLAEPLPVADAGPSPFAQLLSQHFGKKA